MSRNHASVASRALGALVFAAGALLLPGCYGELLEHNQCRITCDGSPHSGFAPTSEDECRETAIDEVGDREDCVAQFCESEDSCVTVFPPVES